MLPGPETMENQRQARENGSAPKKPKGRQSVTVVHQLTSLATPEVKQLKGELIGLHWKYNTQYLDILEMLIPNDRQWVKLRDRLMHLMTQHKFEIHTVIAKNLVAKENAQESAQENENAGDGNPEA